MSRLEIPLPSHFPFRTELLIRKTDLSLDIHVSFASILDLVMEAHLQFLLKYNLTPTNIFGKGVIFANAQILYLGELFYKDIVTIDVGVENFSEKSFDYIFKLTKSEGKLPVATVQIKVLFFDYTTKKVAKIPDEFIKLFPNTKKVLNTESISQKSKFWTKAHSISIATYKISMNFPKDEQNHLTMRIRKVATSLPLSIVELESKKNRETILKSLARTRGYLEELRYYLILANDLNYSNSKELILEIDSLEKELKEIYLKKE